MSPPLTSSANLSPTVESGDKSTSLTPASTIQPEFVQPPQIDKLNSTRNVDYTKLRDLLAAKNWKDADYETYLVMLLVVGRKEGDWIRHDELRNFPCTELTHNRPFVGKIQQWALWLQRSEENSP